MVQTKYINDKSTFTRCQRWIIGYKLKNINQLFVHTHTSFIIIIRLAHKNVFVNKIYEHWIIEDGGSDRTTKIQPSSSLTVSGSFNINIQ